MSERNLKEVAFEVTHKCNLRCEHCYNEDNLGHEKEMGTSNAVAAMETIRDFGAVKIKFGGGEPLARKDFFELYDNAIEMGFDVNFSTNGLLLSERMDEIIYHDVKKLQISIDGIGDLHDKIRNQSGLFNAVEKNIVDLNKNGVKVNIATTLTKSNYGEIDGLLDFCKEKEIHRWKIMKYIPKGPTDSLMLERSEYKAAAKKLLELKRKNKSDLEIIIAREFDCISENPDYNDMQCFGGKSFLSMKPNGDITPCSYIGGILCGNILRVTMEEIWNNKEMASFGEDCYDKNCPAGEKCRGGCKAISYYIKGSFSCDPYCWIGK